MDIPITQEQLDRFHNGEFIQRVCPKMLPCEREFIISGTTPQMWGEMFGGCTVGCKPCKYNIKHLSDEELY